MRPVHLSAALLLLCIVGCTSAHRRGRAEAVAPSGYILPTARPSADDVARLTARIAANPEDAEAHRDLGSIYQSRTMLVQPPERFELVRMANRHLETAFAKMPSDPQTLVFLGLARAARGKLPETPLLSKLTLALEGFRLMDDAVAADTENFSLRLIRAKAEALAPAILGRGKHLEEDYAWLTGRIIGDDDLPVHLRALGYLFLGDYHQVHKDEGRARYYWGLARALDTAYTDEAAQRMDGTDLTY